VLDHCPLVTPLLFKLAEIVVPFPLVSSLTIHCQMEGMERDVKYQLVNGYKPIKSS
jgi:hypothetical protein